MAVKCSIYKCQKAASAFCAAGSQVGFPSTVYVCHTYWCVGSFLGDETFEQAD